MSWYAKFISAHPYIMVFSVAGLSIICLMVSIWTEKLPEFSDPQLGFETRGTTFALRLTTWENLIKASQLSGPLVMNPNDNIRLRTKIKPTNISDVPSTVSYELLAPKAAFFKSKRKKGPTLSSRNDFSVADSDIGRISTWVSENNTAHRLGATDRLVETIEKEEWASLKQNDVTHDYNDNDGEVQTKHVEMHDNDDADYSKNNEHNHSHVSADGFFCEGLSGSYAHVVVVPTESTESLFTLKNIKCMCALEDSLMSGNVILDLCETVKGSQCCPPWSLPNYIALLNNRTSCFQITEKDIEATRALLSKCYNYFINYKLEPMCDERKECANVSKACRDHDAVFNILQFLVDAEFNPNLSYDKIQAAMVFLPIARSSAVLPYFYSLDFSQINSNDVSVVAVDFGAKGALFDDYLVRDGVLMIGAAMFIFMCVWSYTGSFFLTLCSVIAVSMSLIIAFFLYTFLFDIRFFPFMNLLGIVVALGTGTDDAFIYCKVWSCVKHENDGASLSSLVGTALKSSALSMAVTSFTTTAALFSNCVSPITAINCFSIFAGTAVLLNFFLMVSWLPACVVISENWCLPPLLPTRWRPAINARLRTAKKHSSQVQVHLDRILMLGVLRLRWLWLLSFGGIAVGAAFVVLHYPKLRLPDSKTFQLFDSSHPVEQYELNYRKKFWFERQNKGDVWDDLGKLPLRFVWGVIPIDNGNYLDPASRGILEYDPEFDVTSQETQTWLLQFCRNLRLQPFYQPTLGPLLPNCFIESFKSWMRRRCKDTIRNEDRSPCCEASSFPFSRRVFTRCLPQAVSRLYDSPSDIFQPGVAGPRFARSKRHEVKSIVIEYESNWTYSNSFHDMESFFKTVDSWFQTQLASAPPGLKKGWFISDLGFYDLQMALSDGTVTAIALSLGVALIVVFLTTLNALVSIFTVLTISAIIFVTVAILILLGWKLNILESVAVTTAIGLAVDFSLHYGVHYRLAGEELRKPSVVHALSRMSGPTAMGALTTGAAGVFMLPSDVLPYIQIGILLVVLTVVSWLYSTVFLMSLLAVAGPEHGCGQFSRPSPKNWCRAPTSDKPPVPGLWSESTLSTSSGPAEVHELEALTKGQRRTRRPRSQSPAVPEEDNDSLCQLPNTYACAVSKH